MRQNRLMIILCAALMLGACTDKKPSKDLQPNLDTKALRGDSMPEKVKVDSSLLVNDGTVVPYFPGGLEAMRAYIKEHLHYPEVARKMKKEGRVIISAQVDEKGKLSGLKVMMSDDPIFDEEAMRVVKTMPRFVADKEGKVVAGQVKIPVIFRLSH